MPTLKFAVLPGDYIGPEVMTEALRVLEHVAKKEGLTLSYKIADVGGAGIDNHGKALPDSTLALCRESDAILFGSVGGPKWEKLPPSQQPERAALLPLRKAFNLFANIRPGLLYSDLRDASPLKTERIPNGIDIARFAPLRALRPAQVPPVLCLIGRVVPIKDVKNFIRALRSVINQLPEAEGWIAGPENEDPAYAEECKLLIASLGLQDRVRFLGFQQLTELLPKVGLVVLSSISEALPLVLLEGFAAGVPAVSTDVGSCRQLIEGLDDEDRALGPSGRVVGLADPKALADAAVELLSDPAAWQRASDAGVERVRRYYSLERMLGRYRDVYERALTWQASVSS